MASASVSSSPPYDEKQVEAARLRLQNLAKPYLAAQQGVHGCVKKLKSLTHMTSYWEGIERFRAIGDRYELWPLGFVLVFPSACGAVIWAAAFALRLPVIVNAVAVFAAVAFSFAICAHLLWSPARAVVKSRLKELDFELIAARRELVEAEAVLKASEGPYRAALEQHNFIQAQVTERRRQQEIAAEQYRKSRQYQCEQLLQLNWKAMRSVEFEQFLKRVFEVHGHQVETTRTSGDQGVDLLVICHGRKIAIQVKGYHSSVGNSAVQEAYAGCGFYRCDVCAVITNSRFTSSAQELASRLGCILIDEDLLPRFILGQIHPFGGPNVAPP